MKKRILLSGIFLSASMEASSLWLSSSDIDKMFYNEISDFFDGNNIYKHYKMNLSFRYPRMNSSEDKDSYRFEFNLAGFDKNDIKVTINSQNILTIKGVKKQLSKQDKKNLLKQEQFYGSFSRSISLPSDIDKNKINLTYNNGVLKIVIQKDILHKDIRTLEIK